MNLTRYSDYSLRVLLYLSLRPDRRVSIDEMATFYNISKDHLIKVVNNLGKLGYVETIRGRHGGIELAQEPETIFIGEVIRHTEPNFHLVECFDPKTNHCQVTNVCLLQSALAKALKAFFDVLDQCTLGDLVANPETAVELLNIETQSGVES